MFDDERSNVDLDVTEDEVICYIEPNYGEGGSPVGKLEWFYEDEWRKVQPPARSTSPYTPLVTARQIDLVRTRLQGKRSFKLNPEPSPARLRMAKEGYSDVSISLTKRMSSAKFLETHIYD